MGYPRFLLAGVCLYLLGSHQSLRPGARQMHAPNRGWKSDDFGGRRRSGALFIGGRAVSNPCSVGELWQRDSKQVPVHSRFHIRENRRIWSRRDVPRFNHASAG